MLKILMGAVWSSGIFQVKSLFLPTISQKEKKTTIKNSYLDDSLKILLGAI